VFIGAFKAIFKAKTTGYYTISVIQLVGLFQNKHVIRIKKITTITVEFVRVGQAVAVKIVR